jgi:hypothetical protein
LADGLHPTPCGRGHGRAETARAPLRADATSHDRGTALVRDNEPFVSEDSPCVLQRGYDPARKYHVFLAGQVLTFGGDLRGLTLVAGLSTD